MKKTIYTPPHLEELSVEDMQLLAGSDITGGGGDLEYSRGDGSLIEDASDKDGDG